MKRRIAIGLLDEDSYDEYHNLVAQGVLTSAREHDIDIIRFGHFLADMTTSDPYQEGIVHEYIRQFKLDGLIFLGWARAAHNPDFKKLLEHIPMVSFGSSIKGVPSVLFHGEEYIREILSHLILTHKTSRIAYIAPIRPDGRAGVYREIMEQYRIYDPRLFISEKELEGLNIGERGIRAAEILLDERNVRFDAIVSLYNEETYELINALKTRGIRVPDDIAVTSYEDGELSKHSTPAFTTVYFPWRELGYYACEAIYALVTKGRAPMATQVHGKVIYRDSCGCIPYSAMAAVTGSFQKSGPGFDEISESDLDKIAESFIGKTPFSIKEMQTLLYKFKIAYHDGSKQAFLMTFEMLLRKVEVHYDYSAFTQIAALFREKLLPFFLPFADSETKKLVWAETLFYQMQIILYNKLSNEWFREDVEYENAGLVLKDIGQILITDFNINDLAKSLETNLHRIGVQGCYIYLFNNEDNNHVNFDDYRLEFEYCSGKWIRSHRTGAKKETGKFPEFFLRKDRSYFLLANLLYVGSYFIGFIVIDPMQIDLRIYRNLCQYISAALNGVILLKKLNLSYRRLMEQAHSKGMANSTGILHDIANIMNSVNVTAQSLDSLMSDNVIKSLGLANEMLEKKLDMLNEFIRSDPKGKMLMQYYTTIAGDWDVFRNRLKTCIARLLDKIGLIAEIVNAQQSYAEIRSSLEQLELAPVIEDVLSTNSIYIEKQRVRIVRNYESAVTAMVQKTKFFHILTNIVKNAIESMENTDPDDRVLSVDLTEEAGYVFIRVTDTGCGIADENLESIFAYGFTTKKDGHGFGLHSCANYMTEMKGRLWAQNCASGKGAAFTLQFKAPR